MYVYERTTIADRRVQLLSVNLEKAVSITTTKGSLQYDPNKRGEVTIGERTFTIDHCLFNYAINECKVGESAVFVYTRQTLSQAICVSKTICMIATNALLAREGYSTPFYFDLRHGEELSEKAINQLKTCAADLYGQDGQIILCREITPVLRMMANGLDVPVLLSVPVLRNEKEITRKFYKALKNNAHEVAAGHPLASISSALLKSLGAENLLISKLDSTGPGLWKVDQSIFVTSPSSLVPAPGSQMSLQIEQTLHMSLSSSAVDALTIVEVVRLLKNDDQSAGADYDSDADDIDASDANNHNQANNNDNFFDSHTDHPLSDHHSSHSSCHSDLSVLASTIPDLAAVQALAHFAAPTEVTKGSLNSVDVAAKGTSGATKPTNRPTTQQDLPRKAGPGSKVSGHTSRAASIPISSSPSAQQS